jgi:hypothetical protein
MPSRVIDPTPIHPPFVPLPQGRPPCTFGPLDYGSAPELIFHEIYSALDSGLRLSFSGLLAMTRFGFRG